MTMKCDRTCPFYNTVFCMLEPRKRIEETCICPDKRIAKMKALMEP